MTPSLILCELARTGLEDVESFSPFCLKVHRALKAARLPYTSLHGAHPGEFKKMNPAGQVPVLLVDGEPVYDSSRILQKIDEIAPGRIMPTDPALRAEAYLWEELADTSLNGYLVAARWMDERNWPKTKEAYFSDMPSIVRAVVVPRIRSRVRTSLLMRDVIRQGLEETWRRFEELLDMFDARAPEKAFWVGRTLSFADLAIFAQLGGLRTPLTLWQSAKIAERPRLAAYLDRVDAATRDDSSSFVAEPHAYSATANQEPAAAFQ